MHVLKTLNSKKILCSCWISKKLANFLCEPVAFIISQDTRVNGAKLLSWLGWLTRIYPRNHVLDGGWDAPLKEAILRVVQSIEKHWECRLQCILQKLKAITQSSIMAWEHDCCSELQSVPDYPCGKSGKYHGPRASEGPQESEKNCHGLEYPKMLSTEPCMQKN